MPARTWLLGVFGVGFLAKDLSRVVWEWARTVSALAKASIDADAMLRN
jgi:hypothetical protein